LKLLAQSMVIDHKLHAAWHLLLLRTIVKPPAADTGRLLDAVNNVEQRPACCHSAAGQTASKAGLTANTYSSALCTTKHSTRRLQCACWPHTWQERESAKMGVE
jgi:hypothetical protein